MSAEPLELVAWRGANGFTKWHLSRVAYPNNLLCPATIPPGAVVDRKPDIGADDLCENCRAALHEQTARNLKVIA